MKHLKSIYESMNPDDIRMCFDGLLEIGFSYNVTDLPRKRGDTRYIMVEIIKIDGVSRDFTSGDDIKSEFYWTPDIKDEIRSSVGKAEEMGYTVEGVEVYGYEDGRPYNKTMDMSKIKSYHKLSKIEIFYKENS